MRTTLPRAGISRRIVLALALALPASVAVAGDEPAPRPAPPPPSAPPAPPPPAPPAASAESLALGAKYFDQAISWVARGGTLGKTRDFYAQLEVVWDLPDNHHEGQQQVWFEAPDKMRTVMTAGGQSTTKILNGDQAWSILASGVPTRIHGTPDGAATLRQLKEDLTRMQDLTDFVTLEGLKGPGVIFEFEKKTTGTVGGIYEGKWLKINRRSPDGRKMTFWIAYDADERDEVLRATWPGVVSVDGDVAQKLHTEHWILRDWDTPSTKPRAFRYPRKVQGWRLNPDKEAAKADPPKRFVAAILEDVQMNQGIEPAKFAEPK